MALGDLIARDYQYEFRNLLFGSGTPFVVTGFENLLGSGDVAANDIERQYEHGMFPGLLRYTARVAPCDMTIVGNAGAEIEQNLALARKAFQVPRKRLTMVMDGLVFKRPGEPKKVLYCRCTRRAFKSSYETAHGYSEGSLEFTAPDPIIYGLDVKTQALVLAVGSVTNNVTITSEGDFVDGSYPVVTINGPATNPRVQNVADDGRTLRADLVLAAGDALKIDQKTKQCLLRVGVGGAWVDAWQYMRTDNQFWNVLPGPNQIVYTRAGATGASSTVTIDWQDAFA